MNAFTLGAGGTDVWLQDGPRNRMEGASGCAGSTSSMGAADTGCWPFANAAGGLGWRGVGAGGLCCLGVGAGGLGWRGVSAAGSGRVEEDDAVG